MGYAGRVIGFRPVAAVLLAAAVAPMACRSGYAASPPSASTQVTAPDAAGRFAVPQPADAARSVTPLCGYRVLNTFPHDPAAFTQGLLVDGGELFESTGLWGSSTLRRVELATGEVLQVRHLDSQYFGEGLAADGSRLIQLTYLSYLGFVYDRDTFDVIGTVSYPTQGWGLTSDGNRLVMSDGSSKLFFRDPDSFEELGRVDVWDENGPVVWLNELERIGDHVWANILYDDRIARIDPVSGRVTSWVDLSDLGPQPRPGPLNGIAYDSANGRLLVTGKLWPTLYEIELVDCPDLLVFSTGFEWGDLSGWQ